MMEQTHQQNNLTESEFKHDSTSTRNYVGKLTGWFVCGHDRMTRITNWMKRRVSWSNSAEKRGKKALAMLDTENAFSRINNRHYQVKSQTRSGLHYDVKRIKKRWTCSCPDHTIKKSQCKHILMIMAHVVDKNAAGILGVSDAGTDSDNAGKSGETTVPDCKLSADSADTVHVYPVNEEVPAQCRHCHCTDMIKYGNQIWNSKTKRQQRYQCKECRKVFVYRAGMERMRCKMKHTCIMLNDYFKGHSTPSIADTLKQHGLSRHPTSILRAIKKYIQAIDKFTSTLPLNNIGDRWHVDEIYQKIRNTEYYNFGIIDHKTRFILAQQIADKKDGFNATNLLKCAADRAGKIPAEFISDCLPSYGKAFNDVYAPRNPLNEHSVHIADPDKAGRKKPSTHIGNAGINKHDKENNNISESFNSIQQACYRPRRGIKSPHSSIFPGFRVWYNFVRTHGTLKCTPAEAAGIKIHGSYKWRTLIGNAGTAMLVNGAAT